MGYRFPSSQRIPQKIKSTFSANYKAGFQPLMQGLKPATPNNTLPHAKA